MRTRIEQTRSRLLGFDSDSMKATVATHLLLGDNPSQEV